VRLPARRHRVRAAAQLGVLAVTAVVSAVAVLAAAQRAALAQPGPPPQGWYVTLLPDGDDTNVVSGPGGVRLDPPRPWPATLQGGPPQGMLLTEVHRLAQPAGQVAAELSAEQPAGSAVAIDVRGLRGDGSWTEWVPVPATAPAVLDAAVGAVQARLVLTAGRAGATPVVRSVRLIAQPAAARTLAAPPREPRSYRVFATREGLVGATTANGHVIRDRDHFVALPSRRALAPRGSGDYTVKICAANGRCEWAPVWDVGPWNTTDDYWNPPADRQAWQDLPQGMPQAQAAYHDDYHDGVDQFGREVLNPAGIDLADGTFWDGLGLRHNSWVTVTYLWTHPGSPASVRIPLLPVRSGPGEQYPAVGLAVRGAKLIVECATTGRTVTGGAGASDRWLRIGPGQFVPAVHVGFPAAAPRCPTP
jgi:hypothetical protein